MVVVLRQELTTAAHAKSELDRKWFSSELMRRAA